MSDQRNFWYHLAKEESQRRGIPLNLTYPNGSAIQWREEYNRIHALTSPEIRVRIPTQKQKAAIENARLMSLYGMAPNTDQIYQMLKNIGVKVPRIGRTREDFIKLYIQNTTQIYDEINRYIEEIKHAGFDLAFNVFLIQPGSLSSTKLVEERNRIEYIYRLIRATNQLFSLRYHEKPSQRAQYQKLIYTADTVKANTLAESIPLQFIENLIDFDTDDFPHFTRLKDYVFMALAVKLLLVKFSNKTIGGITLRYYNNSGQVAFRTYSSQELNRLDLRSMIKLIGFFTDDGIVSGSDYDLNLLDNYIIDPTWIKIVVFNVSGSCDVKLCTHNQGGYRNYKTSTHDTFLCYDFKSKNNNCLIEIFRNVTTNKTLSSKIRHHFKLDKDTPISIDQIYMLETFFCRKICVITSSEYKDDKFIDTIIYGDKNNSDFWVFLSFNNQIGHYSFIAKRLPIKETPKETEFKKKDKSHSSLNDKEREYFFYDYETVFDNDGELHAYSVACIAGKLDTDGSFIENKDKRFIEIGDNCNEKFLSYLCNNQNENKRYLIGYNSSKFDNYILLRQLFNNTLISPQKVMLANASILTMEFLGYKCVDLCKFTLCSLEAGCKSFGCGSLKQAFSHEYAQRMYFAFDKIPKLDFVAYLPEKDKLIEYNINDCICLAELFAKARGAIKSLCGLNIEEYVALGQCMYKYFQNTIRDKNSKLKNKIEVKAPETYSEWKSVKSSMIGGRSQVFSDKPLLIEEEVQSEDCKSLYPYVMKNPECYYPYGKMIKTDEFKEDLIGVYITTIHKQPEVNIIPKRKKCGKLDWTYKKEFTTMLTSVDIQTLKDFNAEITIHNGYYWEHKSNTLFTSFINPFDTMKTYQDQLKKDIDSGTYKGEDKYNGALREMCKLCMNSLSGKFGQRVFENTSYFTRDFKNISEIDNKLTDYTIIPIIQTDVYAIRGKYKDLDSQYNPITTKPVQLCSLIYSYARRHMYKALISKCDVKYCTDTDSLHIPVSQLEKLENKVGFGNFNNNGGQFGDFEGELNFKTKRCYYIAPKCYGIFGDPGKEKMRFKGISRRDKLLIGDPKKFEKLPLSIQFELYNSFPCVLSEHLYRSIYKGEQVYAITSRLRKVAIGYLEEDFGDSAKICQEYIIKKLNPFYKESNIQTNDNVNK